MGKHAENKRITDIRDSETRNNPINKDSSHARSRSVTSTKKT